MKRLLKIIFGMVGTLLLLVVVAAVAAVLFIDPNDYRDTIAAKVQQQTGRELTIEGEIKLSLFPWLGLKLGAMELGNAAHFKGKTFARIESAEARVKLLPLLKLQTKIDTVTLRGLELNLQRRADGVSNWDDLAGSEAAPEKAEQPSSGAHSKQLEQALQALAIGGIALEEANVEFRDALNKQRVALNHLNFSAGSIRIGKAIPIKLSTELLSSKPQVKGTLEFSADVTADPLAQRYRAAALQLTTALSGKGIPGGSLQASLGGDAAVDLEAQQASLKDFTIKGMGAEAGAELEISKLLGKPDVKGKLTLKLADVAKLLSLAPAGAVPADLQLAALNGSQLQANVDLSLGRETVSVAPLTLALAGMELKLSAEGKQILDKPRFSGELSSGEFVPRALLSELGITLPEMADPSAMGKAKVSTHFDGGLDQLALSELLVRFDSTSVGGKASVANFAAPVIRYTLKIDDLDVDRYLPPPSDQPAPAAKGKGAATTELPLELMRSLDIDGTLTVGKVKVMNLHSNTITTTLKARQGRFRVHPLSARLYQGSYSGDLGLDVSGKEPQLSMDEKLSGVQSGPLLKDFMGEDYVSGEANLSAKLTAQGLEPMAVRKSLNGSGSFKFANGMVKGLNLGQKIREGYALYKKQPTPKEELKATDFADLSGSFQVKDGLLSTSDLSARSTLFQVAGKGTVNLVSERLDLRLDTTVVSNIRDATGQNIGDLRGEKVPVTITGSFSDPKFGVDIGSILEGKAKAELGKKKAEVQAEVEAKKKAAEAEAKKRLEAEKKKLEQQTQDKLKKMLKF